MRLIGHWIGQHEDFAESTFEVFDPSTAEPYAVAADGSAADIDRAVDAAQVAYDQIWSQLGAEERSDLLLGVAGRLESLLPAIAPVESRDTGKPITAVSRLEVPAAIGEFRHYAAALRNLRDGMHGGAKTGVGLTLRQPYGVVGLITPFNSPLLVIAEKVAQIVAAGNCVVIKPSPYAPASAPMFARLLVEAGLPPGVVNVVLGSGATAGRALCEHPRVERLSFTGSTMVGQQILRASADRLKRVSLELSGKNACIVFEDADLEAASANAVLSGFLLTGQLCTSGSRILVHRSVAQDFLDLFTQKVAALRIGRADDSSTQLGPLISAERLDSVRRHVSLGETSCKVLYSGSLPAGLTGWFEPPHVFMAQEADHPLMQEEVFGPVSCIMAFDLDDQALALANSTPYGLASFIWTNDWRRIHRFVRQLESGRVWVNTGHTIPGDMALPPWKLSGLGEEGGLEGLLSFTRLKTVNLNATGKAPSF